MDDVKPQKGFITDHHGKPSSMRLMSAGAFLVAAMLATFDALPYFAASVSTEVILYFLIGAFAPKAIQSFAELR